MRFVTLLAATAAILAPIEARAGGPESSHPFLRLVERERTIPLLVQQAASMIERAHVHGIRPPEPTSGSLDFELLTSDIHVDPETGQVSGTYDIDVRSRGTALQPIGLMLDEGLTISEATIDGQPASISTERVAGLGMSLITPASPSPPAGQRATLHAVFSGTLACKDLGGGYHTCRTGTPFSSFGMASIFPVLVDESDRTGAAFDTLRRRTTLHVPEGNDIVMTGHEVERSTSEGITSATWVVSEPIDRHLAYYAFVGKLGKLPVQGLSLPSTLHFELPETPTEAKLVAWSERVIPFVEGLAGRPLPFQTLSLIKLPMELGDPGTATMGMTLLSEVYEQTGALMHEETWAHENSHLFWGIVAPATDVVRSRLLDEGLATLSQLDYSHTAHFAGEDRDAYLARRFAAIHQDLRHGAAGVPPIYLPPRRQMPAGQYEYTIWAYEKTAAALDHLRVTIGEEVFRKGLARYVATCSYIGCSVDDFRRVMEDESDQDLRPFFERWITDDTRPELTLAWSATEGGVDVTLTKEDEQPLGVELWARLEGGGLVRERVTMTGGEQTFSLSTPGPVRSVRINPRHDGMIAARSATDGDIDFDGDADGLDLLTCARFVGRAYREDQLGIWQGDAKAFEPRCDVDEDGRVDSSDIDALAEQFGTLRTTP